MRNVNQNPSIASRLDNAFFYATIVNSPFDSGSSIRDFDLTDIGITPDPTFQADVSMAIYDSACNALESTFQR